VARHRYLHLDVFTDQPLAGNQLAVFPHGEAIPQQLMQRIAAEMAFSETTFLLPPEHDATDVRMRIFTPRHELPMAGHPTVGSSFALAHEGVIASGRERFTFGLGVGPTEVRLDWRGEVLGFAWMRQQVPRFGPVLEDREALAAALGLAAGDLAAAELPAQCGSAGVPVLLVPLASRRAVDAAVLDAARIRAVFAASGCEEMGVFVFTTEPGPDAATVYSRMFAPMFGIAEDPATGGASGPLGAYLLRHGVVDASGARGILSLQGVAMGRPSHVHVDVQGDAAGIGQVLVGGHAVLVGEGTLVL